MRVPVQLESGLIELIDNGAIEVIASLYSAGYFEAIGAHI